MNKESVIPDAIDGSFVPLARPGVTSIEVEGEGLLFDAERNSWHLLSPTALIIWQCCDGSGTVEELSQDLATAYQTDVDIVRVGTIEAVRQLGREGLLDGVREDSPDRDPSQAHDHDHEDGAHDLPPVDQPDDEPRFLRVPPSG